MTQRSGPASFAILTASGPAAIAVVAVWGSAAADTLAALTGGSTPPARIPDGQFRLVRWLGPDRDTDPDTATGLAEDVLVCRFDQLSFEIHCHGGAVASRRIVRDLERLGAQESGPGEWLARSFPWPAVRCQLALARCTTVRTSELVIRQGEYWEQLVARIRAGLESGELAGVLKPVDAALAWNDGEHNRDGSPGVRFQRLLEPRSIVLFGPPNAGKSSLLNRLTGFERSIVHPEAGTTRDVVTSHSAIGGWPVVVADTAGLRDADQPVEQAGVALARSAILAAGLRLLVIDCANPPAPEAWLALVALQPDLVLANKIDLAPVPGLLGDDQPLGVSALAGHGLESLLERIESLLESRQPPAGLAVPLDQEMADWLQTMQAGLRGADTSTIRALLDRQESRAAPGP
jgi:tRNA modification GTPase